MTKNVVPREEVCVDRPCDRTVALSCAGRDAGSSATWSSSKPRAARVGSSATLTLDEFPSETFHGKVTRTSQSIDMASRTLNTEIDVDNPTGQLLPGVYVHVHLRLPSQTRSVLIPANAAPHGRQRSLNQGVGRRLGRFQATPDQLHALIYEVPVPPACPLVAIFRLIQREG